MRPTQEEMQGHMMRLHEEERVAEADRRRRLRQALQAIAVLQGSFSRPSGAGDR
jgi:hypothetical protein